VAPVLSRFHTNPGSLDIPNRAPAGALRHEQLSWARCISELCKPRACYNTKLSMILRTRLHDVRAYMLYTTAR
jgi:hypothetical protein